jgi:hypothetical protein
MGAGRIVRNPPSDPNRQKDDIHALHEAGNPERVEGHRADHENPLNKKGVLFGFLVSQVYRWVGA